MRDQTHALATCMRPESGPWGPVHAHLADGEHLHSQGLQARPAGCPAGSSQSAFAVPFVGSGTAWHTFSCTQQWQCTAKTSLAGLRCFRLPRRCGAGSPASWRHCRGSGSTCNERGAAGIDSTVGCL